MGAEKGGNDGVATRMRAGIAEAVRAGGRLAGQRPAALAAFLAAAAFAPFLGSGTGELNVLLNQLGSLGSGYLTEFGWMLGDAAERLSELVGQGARHGSDLQAARAEVGALTALLQRVVRAQDDSQERAPARPARCPYPGMRQFESRDAARFFGREDLTAHLIARLSEQASANAPLLVFGPSGAGKSSLLRAGLIPALRRGRLLPISGSATWPLILVDRLGADPLATLAAAMGGPGTDDDPASVAAGLGPAGRFVLVVDQFEEIFTECADGEARTRFVRALLALAARGLVVLSVRADFYQDCAGLADLGGLLADNQLVVGPLAEDDLRRAITLPAVRAGCTVEAGLPELMITDVGLRPGVAGYEPGALPLLAYALRATWDRRAGSTLTVAGYREAGGIHGAVAAEAERICADLPAGGADAARRMMLRLVNVGREGQLTRRRVPRAELLAGLDETGAVLARFTHARLVTGDEDGVEITHEAFLTAWPRLATWIAEDGAGLRLRRQLDEDARAWAQESQDAGGLYRGARLSGAISWRAANEAELTGLERSFLDASTAAEHAIRHRERRQNRRLRVLSAGLAVVLLMALTAGGAAVGQQRLAVRESGLQQSEKFAAQSDDALPVNLRTADLDALAAYQADRTEAALSSLLSRQADPYLGSVPEPAPAHTTALAVSPDGALMAVGEEPGLDPQAEPKSSIQRDTARWQARPLPLTAQPEGATRIAVSPDGSTVALGTGTGTVLLLSTGSYRIIRQIRTGQGQGLMTLAFSPDSRLLATASSGDATGTVRLWHAAGGTLAGKLGPGTSQVRDLAFSLGGRMLAVTGQDATVWLWNLATRTPQPTASLAAYPAILGNQASATSFNRVAFLPGDRLVTVANDGTATVWNLNPDREVTSLCAILGRSSVALWWQQQSPAPGPEPCTATTAG